MDKLDGKIPEEYWERKMGEWRPEEQQVKVALLALATTDLGDRPLDAGRVLELANQAYLLYSQDSTEKAKLLRMLCSDFSMDDVSATRPLTDTPSTSSSKGPKWKNGRPY